MSTFLPERKSRRLLVCDRLTTCWRRTWEHCCQSCTRQLPLSTPTILLQCQKYRGDRWRSRRSYQNKIRGVARVGGFYFPLPFFLPLPSLSPFSSYLFPVSSLPFLPLPLERKGALFIIIIIIIIIINEKISVAFSPKTARTRNTQKRRHVR